MCVYISEKNEILYATLATVLIVSATVTIYLAWLRNQIEIIEESEDLEALYLAQMRKVIQRVRERRMPQAAAEIAEDEV